MALAGVDDTFVSTMSLELDSLEARFVEVRAMQAR